MSQSSYPRSDLLKRAPEALDLSVGLRTVGPHIPAFDTGLDRHSFKGMVAPILTASRAKLRGVIGSEFFHLNTELAFERLHAMQGGKYSC